MPLDKSIKKVLIIGSGPIVIGQAAEFDYAGTQACRAMREEGIEVVLINSNPATIMTDSELADHIYIEPLDLDIIKRIIIKERPDSILPSFGGQTGLNLSMELAKSRFLAEQGVRLLSTSPETIDMAEDRKLFKEAMESIGEPCIPSVIATTVEEALDFAEAVGYPIIIRPAFTLGGTGGGIASNEEELRLIASNGIRLSPIHQILAERSVAGWKEIEFEVVRDNLGNVLTVCSMENFDPVGVHTGDSIVVAPAMTLSDVEYQMLRSSALRIITKLDIKGGCNCQFALNPDNFEYAVIEVNPRVSRSSALASKATGYPIARIAAKIAVGYNLGEIKNEITGKTCAFFEPVVDYAVVKFPKWPFDKFVYASKQLGTQMKATGEVMAIGASFEEALMKAVRGAEISLDCLRSSSVQKLDDQQLLESISKPTDMRLFYIFEALRRDFSTDEIYEITKIDRWFLSKLNRLISIERELESSPLDDDLYMRAKRLGYLDSTIERLSGQKIKNPAHGVYRTVDTCAAEFSATTPYFYGSFMGENEALNYKTGKKTVVVFGSGPIRIGQGIEFDYSAVHCVRTLRRLGYETVIVNNNPETVSTDYDTADRLYFEPLTNEDVMHIINTEKPIGVVVAFGGQTAIKLTNFLAKQGVNILGTSADSIDAAEDRERFDALLESLNIKRPKGLNVRTKPEALTAANTLGYPVLIRPSYVLGGQNMIIAWSDSDIEEYLDIILASKIDNPILIDKYMSGIELDIDAICDGEDILIPGIMEHIERAGIHSGDSIAVYPPYNIDPRMIDTIVNQTAKIATALKVRGLVNIQYLVYDSELYVIEVNPRASRTVPYISKVTKIPMVDLAVRACLGEKLTDMGYGTGLAKTPPYTAVKVPVFSFEKLVGVDAHLGPEMKSTGEVLGIGSVFEEALYKGLVAAGCNLNRRGGVLFTVRNLDKSEVADLARKYAALGFDLYATAGTAQELRGAGLIVKTVKKLHEGEDNILRLIESGKLSYVISTSARGRLPTADSVKIRRKALEHSIPCLTSIDTANAVADSLLSRYSPSSVELVDINNMREKRRKLPFIKYSGIGNDYIYFDCRDDKLKISSPEALAIRLSNRHFSIGADGVVLITDSKVADVGMRIYNRDGSEGRMAGNATRCVAKYLYDQGFTRSNIVTIETLSGIKEVELHILHGEVIAATTNMGAPEFSPAAIPVLYDGAQMINSPLVIGDKEYRVTALSLGNPHCVTFLDELSSLDIETIGPLFERHQVFPQRVNAEFATVIKRNVLKVRVWERGNGETLACGTGACAAAVAAVENGYCDKGKDITVRLPGGDLRVKYTGETIYLSGNAEKTFEGFVEV
ncbi:MAG: carbamoyl-phosphate synthase large subunit [Clostridiales bacterium]|nr:carbamoyl-phosphate synthase large subunit [Clostridiales bacterium]